MMEVTSGHSLEDRRRARREARLDKGWSVRDDQMGLDKFNLKDPYIAELLRKKKERMRKELMSTIKVKAGAKKDKKREGTFLKQSKDQKGQKEEATAADDGKAGEPKKLSRPASPRAVLKSDEAVRLAYDVALLYAEMKALISSQQEINEAHSEIAADVDFATECLARRFGQSQFIWKIDKFMEKYEMAKSGETLTIHSPCFKTHAYGYSLSINICPYGDRKAQGEYMSLFFCLMKGIHDPLLPWPFCCNIQFAIESQFTYDLYQVDDQVPTTTTTTTTTTTGGESSMGPGSPLTPEYRPASGISTDRSDSIESHKSGSTSSTSDPSERETSPNKENDNKVENPPGSGGSGQSKIGRKSKKSKKSLKDMFDLDDSHVVEFGPDLNDQKVVKCLQRPKLRRNPCLGFPRFISLEKLWSGKFLREDTLYIKVAVDLNQIPLIDPTVIENQ